MRNASAAKTFVEATTARAVVAAAVSATLTTMMTYVRTLSAAGKTLDGT